MGIAPISGLTSYSAIERIQPMNYAIENSAEFSDVYKTDSAKGTANVSAASPVRYPNAYIASVDTADKLAQAQKTDMAFNKIAADFNGQTTGYSSASKGYTYQTVGSTIDFYA